MSMTAVSPATRRKVAPSRRKIRVLVVDDSPVFLDVVCEILAREPGVEVVGRAEDGTEALHQVAALAPDLVLMDVEMPHMNGPTATVLLSAYFPSTKVVLMSAEDSVRLRLDCLASGARAFVWKTRFKEQLDCAMEALEG